MEKRVVSIVFRRMTYADFRHINKVGGEEQGGGGQSYIDFPIKDVSLDKWHQLLGSPTGFGAGDRPYWNFEINSLGITHPITLKIYQRRPASVSIASQKIHSRESNRVPSWHPDNGFPDDYNPDLQNLVIYIVKTIEGEYWAGWFLQDSIPSTWVGNTTLGRMFNEPAGYLTFKKKVFIDTANSLWPFHFNATEIENEIPTEEDKELELELEDTSPKLQENISQNKKPELTERVIRIRQRNNKIVKELKKLYGGKCQITGEELTFKKINGEFYCELHHLVPLGEDGSDSYANAIIVSPLIHRMLHYANVSEIDLSKIENNQLSIEINGVEYKITWHPEHLRIVEEAVNSKD
ncbi:hypothetical protein [Dysgonomonas sp. 25]|uniref:HNH endonuclease n=1 Tax=Dysgonomonas sp. 25 TaxID=2302933 RepID=UPI0013D5FE22|nr:hypothetical protein [Dysgonomonas sp. 25]NDV67484.1 hypothetical protein [Dysgonomonas sp. 25]